MKLLYTILVFTFAVNICLGQVGIKTTNPQKALHIGGTTSTIRVDGLNATNNTTQFVAGEDNRVHVNTNGNLVLDAKPYTPKLLVDLGNNLVGTAKEIKTDNVGARITKDLKSGTFIIDKKGNYKINFAISVDQIKRRVDPANGKYWLIDGDAKLITVNCFIDGNLVCQAAKIYMSKNVGNPNNQVALGVLTLEAKAFVFLNTTGNHTYKLQGVLEGETKGVRADFGNPSKYNTFQIIGY